MLTAIETKYIGPTNFRGSRIKAIARRRNTNPTFPMRELSLIDSWDYSASAEENHARVAKLLAVKLKWAGRYVGGSLDGAGYVFVNTGNAMRHTSHMQPDRDYFIVERQES